MKLNYVTVKLNQTKLQKKIDLIQTVIEMKMV